MNKLDYLAPPPSAYKLIHEDIDIKWDKGDGKFLRRIFNRVPYAEYEIQQILEFRKLYPEMVDQKDSLILRFIQAGSFQSKDPLSRAYEMLSKYLSWKQTEVLMTPNIQKLLQDGAVYQFGRDIRHRPIIYFDIPKLKKHLQEPYLIDAIVYLLKEIEQVMLLEYHVEQWVIVLNIDFMGIISLPIGILRKIIEQTSTNFCCLMYRMFIVNPSYTLKTAWRVLSSKYNAQRAHINNGTSDKIQFINDNDFTDMLKIIPNTQLEQKFGGTASKSCLRTRLREYLLFISK
ncbi:hypothetical protein pb186bvf_002316 [Paramecium bursaria]